MVEILHVFGGLMKKLAIAIAAVELIGTPAFAADMAVKMPVKAPPPAPTPVFKRSRWMQLSSQLFCDWH